MTERALTAQFAFKSRYPRTLEITVAIGVVLHIILFLAVPAIRITPYRLPEEKAFELIQIPNPIEIMKPPKEVARPQLPTEIDVTDTADPTATMPFPVVDPFSHPVTAPPPPEKIFVPVDQEPAILKRVPPVYPDLAREAQASGTVRVEVLIGVTGRVLAARVVESDTIPALERAALDAARQWLFTPGLQRHRPVKTRVVIPFVFSLH
jgi:protein TonB